MTGPTVVIVTDKFRHCPPVHMSMES